MIKKFVSYCLLFCLVTFSLAPLGYFSWARAADGSQGGLVPCGLGGDPCTVCDLLVLANNIFGFLIAVSVGIAILLAVVAGILYITSGGSSRLIVSAKRGLKYVLIGFAASLLAWVFINMLATTLGYKGPDKVWWDFSDITCVWETKEPLGIGGSEFSTSYLSTDLEGKNFDYNNLPNFHVYVNNADGSREDISDQVELAYSSVPGVELVPGEDGGLSFSLAGATDAISQGAGATQQGGQQASLLGGQTGMGALALLLPLLLIFKLKDKKGSGGMNLKNILKNVLTLFLLINLKGSGLLDQLGNGGLNNGNQETVQNNGQGADGSSTGDANNTGNSGCSNCGNTENSGISRTPQWGGADVDIPYKPDAAKCKAINPTDLDAARHLPQGNNMDKRLPFIFIRGKEYTGDQGLQKFKRLAQLYSRVQNYNSYPLNTKYISIWESEGIEENNCPVGNRPHYIIEVIGSQRGSCSKAGLSGITEIPGFTVWLCAGNTPHYDEMHYTMTFLHEDGHAVAGLRHTDGSIMREKGYDANDRFLPFEQDALLRSIRNLTGLQ